MQLDCGANPRRGTYNMDKTVSENLNMAKPILSRFDLVFILRDRADTNLDQMVSSNIMNLYRKTSSVAAAQAPSTAAARAQACSNTTTTTAETENQMSLSERLAWVTVEFGPELHCLCPRILQTKAYPGSCHYFQRILYGVAVPVRLEALISIIFSARKSKSEKARLVI
jgi:hypothetical protein